MEKADPISLRGLIDKVASIKGSLLTIGTVDDVLNAIFTHLTVSKLDDSSKEAYAEKQDFKKLPTFDDCYCTLSRRCQYLESCSNARDSDETSSSKSKPKNAKSSKSLLTVKTTCVFCQAADHTITRCEKFEESCTIPQRIEYATKNALCKNCLAKGHSVTKCPSKSRCRKCNGSHHTKLHLPTSNSPFKGTNTQSAQPNIIPATQLCGTSDSGPSRPPSSFLIRSSHRALIPTAVVLIKDNFGIFQPIRAILDSGSEVNLITEETAKRLRLQQLRVPQFISGIGESDARIKFEVEATIRSRVSSFEWSSRFAAIRSISNTQPSEHINTSHWVCPRHIEFADPLFYKPNKVDLLISSEVFFDLLLHDQISLGPNKPCLINTKLGWIVGGKFSTTPIPNRLKCNMATYASCSEEDNVLKRFWELEEYIQPTTTYTKEEQMCENHFIQNSTIAADSRIQVRLPFKKSTTLLGDSFQVAKRQFLFLERRLERNETLRRLYVDFMREYEELGHMSPVCTSQLNELGYFIPHHPVLRPGNISTKLRVVFDASAKTPANVSLNELLLVGPTIQQDIITTLVAFRLHRCALIADICKMYRQFWVHQNDRKYQRILWRADPQTPLQCYQLNTITYGTSAAPFLAVRSLFLIADTYRHMYPIGAEVLKRDFYVDDVLTGADCIAELQQIKDELTNILALSKLELAKWNSNCTTICEPGPEEVPIDLGNEVTKALGLSWKPQPDVFCYNFQIPLTEACTKRSLLLPNNHRFITLYVEHLHRQHLHAGTKVLIGLLRQRIWILSITARIFDIFGILSPTTVRCKILLQRLWIARLGWDETLPNEFAESWRKIRDDLPHINNIKISRYVLTSPTEPSEIHGFSDASEQAYGCCVYVRAMKNSSYTTTLLIAKSKVAPVKAQSIPRLELCAAALLASTWDKIKHKLVQLINNVYFWTDSKTVLLWLKEPASTLHTFVANRVSKIQELTESITWRHCPSRFNPADIVSRDCSAEELPLTSWLTGPSFLQLEQEEWPNLTLKSNHPIEETRKPHVLNCNMRACENFIETLIERSSSYLRVIRVVVYVHRVFNKVEINSTLRSTRDFPPISTSELDDAFHFIVNVIQRDYFATEMQRITQEKHISPIYQKLSPFICDKTIFSRTAKMLHVGGRLSKAPIPVEAKFPLLLPNNHRFITLYVEHLHRQHLHAGTKVLIGLLRQRIWILNARQVVGRVVRNCVHCFKYRPKLAQQIMADLPADRFKDLQPFLICGVDFCGPILTSYRIRSKVPYKTYVAIFVCFASKAVHIDLVSDLSSDSFIGCLKRFVSRRGIPQKIYCDNATNFAGACNKLQQFYNQHLSQSQQKEIFEHCAHIGLEFRFIPPRSPHFGGLWEAAVKSAKQLLVKHVGEARLSFEELLTVTTEVEAILNSRPLATTSDDPNDGFPITPSHLIGGFNLLSIPEPSMDPARSTSLSRWQRIAFLKQQFWQQWLRDYVAELQTRSRWLRDQTNLRVGQVVLIHDENIPPQQWVMARIINVITGSDGKIRVVDVKTSKGTLRRAIHKLAPLPILS